VEHLNNLQKIIIGLVGLFVIMVTFTFVMKVVIWLDPVSNREITAKGGQIISAVIQR